MTVARIAAIIFRESLLLSNLRPNSLPAGTEEPVNFLVFMLSEILDIGVTVLSNVSKLNYNLFLVDSEVIIAIRNLSCSLLYIVQ